MGRSLSDQKAHAARKCRWIASTRIQTLVPERESRKLIRGIVLLIVLLTGAREEDKNEDRQ